MPKNSKNFSYPPCRYPKLLIIILLFLLGITAYSNSFFNSFHFDDFSSILENPAIENIRDLRKIWDFWPTRFITYLSIAFNYQLGGLNVFGYHVFNFLIHLGSAISVFFLTTLTLRTPVMKKEAISAYAEPIAFFCGAVFLLHPIQTQPVNYIIQRATLLVGFFYVTSLCLYIESRLRQGENPDSNTWKVFYGGSLLAAVLAVFSKESVCTLPLLICLYDFCFTKTKKRPGWKYIVPFLVIILFIPVIMLATKSLTFENGIRRAGEDPLKISAGHYFLTQLRAMVTYLRLLFVPLNQNLDYDYPVAKSILELPVIFSLSFLLVVLFAGIRLFYKYKLVSFGIFWFFITLLPESSFLPINDVIFEHRLYLPMAGFSFFLVSGLYYLFKEKRFSAAVIILSLLVVCYSIMTYQRNKVWKNELTLWDDTVRKSPLKARGYNSRGMFYQAQGNLIKALCEYNKATEINYKETNPYLNRANIYKNLNKFDQAISEYDRAIEIDPHYANSYMLRGYVYHKKGNFVQALSDFNKAIEINPGYAFAYNNRGNLYQDKGNLGQALSDYNKAIGIIPKLAPAYANRGNVYRKLGNVELALSDYTRAIEIDPYIAQAYSNRALLYFEKGEYRKSLADVRKAEMLGFKFSPEFIEKLKSLTPLNKEF